MAWFKADDKTCDHPKFIDARVKGGYAVVGVWFHAGTWSNANLTDGFVPRSWVLLNQADTEAAVLVEVGLWHEDAARDGYQMHDYTDFQPSKAEVVAKRDKDLERKRRGGSARNPNGIQTDSRSPVPVPEPDTSLRDVYARGTNLSAKEKRTRQRLGLVGPEGGNAA